MKTTVKANSESEAKEVVRNKINFHQVVKVREKSMDDTLNDLLSLFKKK